MGNIISLLELLTIGRGAVFCGLILLMFVLWTSISQGRASKLIEYLHDYIVTVLIVFFMLIGATYLAYPNYLDHVESTIASLGAVMQRGDFLYPTPDPYPYHGILYGPALAEIQIAFKGLGLPILIGSKLPGVIAFVLSALILLRLNKSSLSRCYLLYLFPFGLMLFWNRAEPFLLLIVSMSLLLGDNRADNKYLPILLGIFAGAASALKLHGAVYVFAAYLAVVFPAGVSIPSVLLFSIFSVSSFLAFFVPQNVSIFAFFDYLKFASAHGLSLWLWLETFDYLVFLLFPVLVLWRGAKLERGASLNLILILGIEFFITVLGAKPGAGTHHLLPFIPINAFIIQKIRTKAVSGESLIKVLYMSLIIPSLITALTLVLPMVKSWRQFDEAQKEVVQFEKKYPSVVMGLTDNGGYGYAFLRVMLRNKQIDYPAFMDLQNSGVGDGTFAENLNKCSIGSILLQKNGAPFSMNNHYTGKPLLSDKVREAFTEKYTRSETGEYFAVYTCGSEVQRQSQF